MRQGAAGKIAFVIATAVIAAGCADGNLGLSTQALGPETKVDPVCVSLASQITSLQSDGTIERLEKAADGKTSKVQIKRAALQKQAELNKANSDYRARCGRAAPPAAAAQQSASVAPAAASTASPGVVASAPSATASSAPVAALPGQAQD